MYVHVPPPYEVVKARVASGEMNGMQKVPHDLIRARINPVSFRMWLILDALRSGHEWVAVPHEELARYLRTSAKQVRGSVDELVTTGWLETSTDVRTMRPTFRLIGCYQAA